MTDTATRTSVTPEIPAGYVRNREANLVPKDKVKPIDKDRDQLVKKIVRSARKVSGELSTLRADVFDLIAEFHVRSAEKYGATIRGKKGNHTLFSFDGSLKVQVSRGETKAFDERLQVAKSLIDDCIREWSKGSNKNVQALVDHAFQVDKEGKVSLDRILGLRRLDIEDERWDNAMSAIADSIQITGSKRYFRVFERVGETDTYRPIPLDAANA